MVAKRDVRAEEGWSWGLGLADKNYYIQNGLATRSYYLAQGSLSLYNCQVLVHMRTMLQLLFGSINGSHSYLAPHLYIYIYI